MRAKRTGWMVVAVAAVTLWAGPASAADAGPAQSVTAATATTIQPVRFALISSSTLWTKRATAKPAVNALIQLDLHVMTIGKACQAAHSVGGRTQPSPMSAITGIGWNRFGIG